MKLNDILREQDIMLKILAKGRRSALAGLAAELGKRVEKEGRVILTALLRRERLGSTGVGGGVAMADHGITCSMSRSGNVWDNAAMESFFSSLKTERTARKV